MNGLLSGDAVRDLFLDRWESDPGFVRILGLGSLGRMRGDNSHGWVGEGVHYPE